MEPSTYTSSRLTFADDVQGGRNSATSTRDDGMSLLDQLERTTESASSTADINSATDDAAAAASKRKSKALRTPSFFSRSYIAWKKVYDRGVYTPVSARRSARRVSCCCIAKCVSSGAIGAAI